MKRLKITETQLRMLGKQHSVTLNESHIASDDLSEEEKSFLEGYYEMEEGKKATIHHHAAQGSTKDVKHYDRTYDMGDAMKRVNLTDYYKLEGGETAMQRLMMVKPELEDVNGDEYILNDYEVRGERLRVKVTPKDIEKEKSKSQNPNGNYINYSNPETFERVFDGSNIFVKF